MKVSERFTRFCVEQKILRFGDFQLRSGRQSPYFFDFSAFSQGEKQWELGGYYAEKIVESGLEFDFLFGPAYKGIPIAVATAIRLAHDYDRNVELVFNRKEFKQHGDKGWLIGRAPRGRVLLIDDVLTSGQACDEVVGLIEQHCPQAEICGLLVGLDRMERAGIRQRLGIQAIAQLTDIIDLIESSEQYNGHLPAMRKYYQQYAIGSDPLV